MQRDVVKEEQVKQAIISVCTIGQTVAMLAKQPKLSELCQLILRELASVWDEIEVLIQTVIDVINLFVKDKEVSPLAIN